MPAPALIHAQSYMLPLAVILKQIKELTKTYQMYFLNLNTVP